MKLLWKISHLEIKGLLCVTAYGTKGIKRRKVNSKNYKKKMHDKKPNDKKRGHVFNTEDEAREKAKEIGCVGVHTMMDNGKRVFMPCGSHDAYEEAIAKGGHKPDEDKPGKKPKDRMGYHDDEEEDKYHKKPKKKSHTECDDDGNCQCDTEIKSSNI